MADEIPTVHRCPECGHEVHAALELSGPVQHLEDGGHKWSVIFATSVSFRHDD